MLTFICEVKRPCYRQHRYTTKKALRVFYDRAAAAATVEDNNDYKNGDTNRERDTGNISEKYVHRLYLTLPPRFKAQYDTEGC